MRPGAFGGIAAALLLLTLAGCGGIRAAPEPPVADFEAALAGLQTAFAAPDVVDCLKQRLSDPEAQFCRDRIVQALMIAIDLRYQEFELGFFDAHRYASFGATLATLGLSTAGAVVSGGASQLLSAAAAGMTGAREAFKREVLIEQTSVALLTAMRAQRDQVGLRIRLGLRKKAIQYPLGAALADVSAYYRAGTIVGALTGVSEAVGVERRLARQDLQDATLDLNFVPPARGFATGPSPAATPPSSPPPSTGPQDRPRGRACTASPEVTRDRRILTNAIAGKNDAILTSVYNALEGSAKLREAARSLGPEFVLSSTPPQTRRGKENAIINFIGRVVCTTDLMEATEQLVKPLLN